MGDAPAKPAGLVSRENTVFCWYFWVKNASPTGDSVDFVLANDSIRHGVVQLLVVFHHHGVSLGSTESEHRNVDACPYANGNVCT